MRTQKLLAALATAGALSLAGPALGQSTQAGSMNESQIRQVQRALNNAGHDLQVDGKWGPNTRAALRDFQEDRGLQATGRIDRDTMAALDGRSGQAGASNAPGPGHMGSRTHNDPNANDRYGLEKAPLGGMRNQSAVSGSSGAGPAPSHTGSRTHNSNDGTTLGNPAPGTTAGTTSGVARTVDTPGPSHMGVRGLDGPKEGKTK